MFVTFLRSRNLTSFADAHIDIMTSLVSDQSILHQICFKCFLLSYRHIRLLIKSSLFLLQILCIVNSHLTKPLKPHACPQRPIKFWHHIFIRFASYHGKNNFVCNNCKVFYKWEIQLFPTDPSLSVTHVNVLFKRTKSFFVYRVTFLHYLKHHFIKFPQIIKYLRHQ